MSSIRDHEWSVRRAVPGDVPTVQSVLGSAARWLRGRGIHQWPEGSPSLSTAKIGAQVDRGEFRLVTADGTDPAAVIAVSDYGDPDFWSPAELAEPAVYAAKLAVSRRFAGLDLGGWLTRWVLDDEHAGGAPQVRIDVWKTNRGLQGWYRRQGWEYLRTAEADAHPTSLAAPACAGDDEVCLRSLTGVTGGTVLRFGQGRAEYTVARAERAGLALLTAPLAAGYPAGATVVPGRNSGALFRKATGPDPEARDLFTAERAPGCGHLRLTAGQRVITADLPDGPAGARLVRVTRDAAPANGAFPWQDLMAGGPVLLEVERDGRSRLVPQVQAWADPSAGQPVPVA